MSNDCKDTVQTKQNSTSATQQNEQSIYQIQTAAELSESGKLWANSSIFSWRLKDASEDNDVRDAGKGGQITGDVLEPGGAWSSWGVTFKAST